MENSKIKSCKSITDKLFTNDHIKEEAIHVNPMSRAKREYMNIFEDIRYTQEEKLRIVNQVIDDEASIHEQIKCRINRAPLFFELRQWNNALADINFIEQHDKMTDKLYLIKWKCMVYYRLGQVRDEIRQEINDKVISSKKHFEFLGRICEDEITEMVEGDKIRSSHSRKRSKK